MPTIRFSLPYEVRQDLVLSPRELKEIYFLGNPVADQNGNPLTDEAISFFIAEAQRMVGIWLNIRFARQVVRETLNYSQQDFQRWGYLRTTYPVVEPVALNGKLGDVNVVEYPASWLSVRRSNQPDQLTRQVYMVPVAGSVALNQPAYFAFTQLLPYGANSFVPNYWEIAYVTGFDTVPAEIVGAIGKMAAISVFHPLSDLILGAPGVASTSLSLDGLSQSISGSSFSGRLDAYGKELARDLPILRDTYGGLLMVVC
jgi:hypothetical protein